MQIDWYAVLVWIAVPLLLLVFLGVNIRYTFVHRAGTGCILIILGVVAVFLILYGFGIRLGFNIGQPPSFLLWPLLPGALVGFLMTWLAYASNVTIRNIASEDRSAFEAWMAVGEALLSIFMALTLLLYFAIGQYQAVIFSASLGLPIGALLLALWVQMKS